MKIHPLAPLSLTLERCSLNTINFTKVWTRNWPDHQQRCQQCPMDPAPLSLTLKRCSLNTISPQSVQSMNQNLTRSPTVQCQLPRKCPVQLLLLCPKCWRDTDAITRDNIHWHWLASSENPSYIVQTKQISPALKVSAPPTLSKML